MPETIEKEIESPEQDQGTFGDGFFADEIKEKEEKAEKKSVKEKSKEKEESNEEAKSIEDKDQDPPVIDKEKQEDKEGVKESALNKLEERANKLKEQYEEELLKITEEAKKQGIKKEDIKTSSLGDILGSIDTSDIVIKADGNERSFKEIQEEFPEVVQTAAALANKIAQAKIDELRKSGEIVTSEDKNNIIGELRSMRFWMEIQSAHNDCKSIVKSNEFKDWSQKQSPTVKKMLTSDDPEDGIAVLDAYKEYSNKQKEDLSKKEKDNSDLKKSKEKEYTDLLHKNSARNNRAPSLTSLEKTDDDDGKNDWMAGFVEAEKK